MSITKSGKILASLVCLFVAVFCLFACNNGPVTENPAVAAKKEAEQQAQEVLNKLVWDAKDRKAIVESLTFATSNKNYPNVTISWDSDQPDVISKTGSVVRPSFYDERAYLDGENNVVDVVITATVSATYDANGETKSTEEISKQFDFTVLTLPSDLDTGTIKAVKERAWTYVYETNSVSKTLVTNSEVTYQVQLTGIVTAKLNGDTRGFMIHDGSDGIYVYTTNADIEIGDTVSVVGGIYSYYGSLQIGTKDTSWSKVDPVAGMKVAEYEVITPTAWEAKTAPVAGVYSDDAIGHFGGDLFKVEGTLVRKDATGGSSDKYCIVDPVTGEESWIYYKSYTAEMEEEIKANVGKYVQVPGVSYDRDSRINKNEILFVGGIKEVEAPVVSDEQQANVTLQQITLKEEYQEDFDLSEQGVWEVVSGTGIEIDGFVAKVTRGEEDQTVVLKVTVTVGEVTVSKELTVVVKSIVKETPKHAGTKEDPYTASDALLVAGELAEGATSEDTYYVYGQIVAIKEVNTSYGNAEFTISDGKNEFICYRANYLAGEKFTAVDQIKVGDYVVVVGKFTNYKGTLEFAQGCYIDSFGEIVEEAPLKEGQAYKFEMVQTAAGKTVYFTGEMNGYYYNTSEDINAGVDVYVEVVEGGYNLYFLDASGAKHYMGIVLSDDGEHVNAVYDKEETVFTYSEELGTLVAVVNEKEYVFGTRNDKTYTTIGANEVSYEPFYVTLVIAGEAPEHKHNFVDGKCECGEVDPNYNPNPEPVEGVVTEFKENTAYKFAVIQSNLGKTLYLTGNYVNNYYGEGVEDINAAASVYVVAVEGGYNVKLVQTSGTVLYMNVVASGTHINIKFEAAASSVWTYNEELKTLTTLVDGTEYYIGTYGTYASISPSSVDKAATSFVGQYYEGAVETPHEHNFVEGKCECGAEDPNYTPVEPGDKEVTIAEALELADGAEVIIKGTVDSVEAWNTTYGNMNFTLKDETGLLYVFRVYTQVALGDIVTVEGVMASYYETRQIGQGATITITGHDDSYDQVEEGAVTITFDDKAKRTAYTTEQQVWVENGITITNNKASSSSNVADYAAPARFYASSELVIESEKEFTKITFKTNNKHFNDSFTVEGATVTVSGSECVIEFTEAVTSFTIAKLPYQVRVDYITLS